MWTTRGHRICRAAPGPTHTQRHGYTVRAAEGAAPKATACPRPWLRHSLAHTLSLEPAAAHQPHPVQTLGVGRITLSPGPHLIQAGSRGDNSPCCAQLQFSLRNAFWNRAATTLRHGPLCLEGPRTFPTSFRRERCGITPGSWPLLHSGLRQNELKARPLLFPRSPSV